MKKSLLLLVFLFGIISQNFSQTDTINLYDLSLAELLNISIVSASQTEEPIQEAPVPVTIITEDMITKSGAKNLRDLLALYVPGMTVVQDHNEFNIAMRGIYASSQQKILMMINGHRINSRAYNEANPDYSISLDKIKQIEVLRGPASSLYGNVALTAVVNIITKQGNEIDGTVINIGYGNYEQYKASILYGAPLKNKGDVLFWSSFYKTDGEKRSIQKEKDYSPNPVDDGYAYIDRFNDLPSFDFGMNINSGNFSILTYSKYSKYTEPFSGGGVTGYAYKYHQFRKYFGQGPGLSSFSTDADFKYTNNIIKNKLSLTINGYLGFNKLNGNIITNPTTKGFLIASWSDDNAGGIVQTQYNYNFAPLGEGNIIAGAQADRMEVFHSWAPMGSNGEFTSPMDNSTKPLLELGNEVIYSGFAQVKQFLFEKFIFNFGGRYDNKVRHEGADVNNFSPRLAFIYNHNKVFNIKASYAQSFVDAPYWYRYNSLPSYKGSRNLKPELLSSLQLTPNFIINDHFNLNWNIFYNNLKDFIYRDPTATGDEPRYKNAGKLESWGIENELGFAYKMIKIRTNATFQWVLSAEKYPVTKEKVNNIPTYCANTILDINPLYGFSNKLWLNLQYKYIGDQDAPIATTFKGGLPFDGSRYTVPSTHLVNAGLRYGDFKNFTFDFRVYNAFDTKYEQGGSTNFPYPQAGRWYLFSIIYKINNNSND